MRQYLPIGSHASVSAPGTGQPASRSHGAGAAGIDRLAPLSDGDCRTLLRLLSSPMTVAELLAACEIPKSTLYRKLDELVEAGLVSHRTQPTADGHHPAVFRRRIDELTVHLDETGLSVTGGPSHPTELTDSAPTPPR